MLPCQRWLLVRTARSMQYQNASPENPGQHRATFEQHDRGRYDGRFPTDYGSVPFCRRSRTMKLPIFMDNHSTTPMDPRVLEAMVPYFVEKFGNSASRNHAFGWEAEEAVENARKQIARTIHADSKEIV